MTLSAVVAQNDSKAAEFLASSLQQHFQKISVANSLDELRRAIPRQRAQVAVVDLELVSLTEVERLHQEFGATMIVCTHRFPDESMWAEALSAGAVDCCDSQDVRGILQATERNAMAKTNAA